MSAKRDSEFGRFTALLAKRIRQKRPLIHHITNFVVMNDTANVTLGLGALPVMAHAREEAAEMVAAAGALVLNQGTLTREWIESMRIAGKRAGELNVPIIFDPVGAGATRLRTETARRLLTELRVSVVRGNPAEIGALAGAGGRIKGVESLEDLRDPIRVAQDLARKHRTVVAITGKRDILSDGTRIIGVDNGHPLLKTITGSGCMATAVIAAFCAVEQDYLTAAAAGLAYYGLAAELAARQAKGPGSFRSALLDWIYRLTPAQVETGIKVVRLQ
jgi:hydroxyethylthiazole kinase